MIKMMLFGGLIYMELARYVCLDGDEDIKRTKERKNERCEMCKCGECDKRLSFGDK